MSRSWCHVPVTLLEVASSVHLEYSKCVYVLWQGGLFF